MSRPILVTGAAGFIGMHTTLALLKAGHQVVGLDDLNAYYDVKLKHARLERLRKEAGFTFIQADVADAPRMLALFAEHKPRAVIHLAAQAGVRYSLQQPHAYVHSNLAGFLGILEACRHHPVDHLLYASSSSVYGSSQAVPFREDDPADHPVSLYAATKRANELMAHSYSHLYRIPATGLRFFTVYGPWGRPDMAYYGFTESILSGKTITLFHHGEAERDFTYVDDVVESLVLLLSRPPQADSPTCNVPHRVLNVGNREPVALRRFVSILERLLGKKAVVQEAPAAAGDVKRTHADTAALTKVTGFAPKTPLEEGLRRFVAWHREYHAGRP